LFFQQIFEGKNSIAFWIVAVIVIAIFIGAQLTVKNVQVED